MSNELIPIEDLGQSKFGDDKNFAVVASGGGYLPRLQLYGANSELVKEGKFHMAHYGLVRSKTNVEDLTGEVAILVLGWRPKAMEIVGDDVNTFYNPQNDEFKRVSMKSEEQNSGCMFGPEYLVYIPAAKAFATFFMSSKTSRREAPAVRALMGKMALLKAKFIKTKQFSWHGPEVTMCSTIPDGLDDPEFLLELKDQVQKFQNPPESEKELAPEADRAR